VRCFGEKPRPLAPGGSCKTPCLTDSISVVAVERRESLAESPGRRYHVRTEPNVAPRGGLTRPPRRAVNVSWPGGTKPRRNWLRGISKFRRASGRNVKEHESGMEAGGGEERPVLGGGGGDGRTDGRTDGRGRRKNEGGSSPSRRRWWRRDATLRPPSRPPASPFLPGRGIKTN